MRTAEAPGYLQLVGLASRAAWAPRLERGHEPAEAGAKEAQHHGVPRLDLIHEVDRCCGRRRHFRAATAA